MFASHPHPVRHRRRLAGFLALLPLALASLSLAPPPSAGSRVPVTHVVRPGETVWSIVAAAYGGDPRDRVGDVEQANGLVGDTIAPGERLVLP